MVAALTLRLAAKLGSASSNFNDAYLSILFVFGHVLIFVNHFAPLYRFHLEIFLLTESSMRKSD